MKTVKRFSMMFGNLLLTSNFMRVGLTLVVLVAYLQQGHSGQKTYSQFQIGQIPNDLVDNFPNAKVLRLPLKPHPTSFTQSFELFYFSSQPIDGNTPTILFMDGLGTSSVYNDRIKNTMQILDELGYNSVYFHRRGSGYSQIPNHHKYDALIRSDYIIEDIETLRMQLGLSAWAGIISSSYGSFQSLAYAQKYPKSVQRLILSSPINNFDNDQARISQVLSNLARVLSYFGSQFDSLSPADQGEIIATVETHFQKNTPAFFSPLALHDGYLSLAQYNNPVQLNEYLLQILKDGSHGGISDPIDLSIVVHLVSLLNPAKVSRKLLNEVLPTYHQIQKSVLYGVVDSAPNGPSYAACCMRSFVNTVSNDRKLGFIKKVIGGSVTTDTFFFQGRGDSIVPESGVLSTYYSLLDGKKAMMTFEHFGHHNFFDLIPPKYIKRLISGQWRNIEQDIHKSLLKTKKIMVTWQEQLNSCLFTLQPTLKKSNWARRRRRKSKPDSLQ